MIKRGYGFIGVGTGPFQFASDATGFMLWISLSITISSLITTGIILVYWGAR